MSIVLGGCGRCFCGRKGNEKKVKDEKMIL